MKQLMVSFKGYTAPQEILTAVRRGDIGTFCLFTYQNVESPAQLRELNLSLRQAAQSGGHPPPLIGIDQEGGQLIAIAGGATELPGNMALGAARSPELAEKAGRVLGRELLAMGVNLNFAPSLDVNINPDNPVVGIRSFGDDPALVAELGIAQIRGMQAEGVIATAKHFPGHGDTGVDSHHEAPVIDHSLNRMHSIELLPFQAAIEAGVTAVMTSHILFTAVDEQKPATLSSKILEGLLREQMGFDGLIISDAMDMYAVARYGWQESVQAALEAGNDLVLLGHMPNQLELNRLLGKWYRPASEARILKARQASPAELPPLSVVGCAQHQAIAQEIADRSITLVRDNGVLPLHPSPDEQITVITIRPTDLTPADTSSQVAMTLGAALKKRHPHVNTYEISYHASEKELAEVLQATYEADILIMGTINAEQDPQQGELVRAIWERGQRPIVIAMRTPYDLASFPMIETYLCAYGIRQVTTEAIAKVLFGEIGATGILPCAIPGMMTSGG
ncbi:MAG: beta-N-acetylhexosaminidase [Anaerolineae bacterium]|nr:beta-N-acetylhexosaminidase [Anaerolineae bacterium]